jgi:hypothetical protein
MALIMPMKYDTWNKTEGDGTDNLLGLGQPKYRAKLVFTSAFYFSISAIILQLY